MDSTWEDRDLPVLRAVVRIEDDTQHHVRAEQIKEATGLDDKDVQRALGALARENPPFFEIIDASSMGGTFYMGAVNCTGHARRTVGSWPTPDNLADRIIAGLQEAADNAPSEEERSRARKVLDGVGGVGKGVLTGVLVKVLSGEVG
jgi:hypothetical protein